MPALPVVWVYWVCPPRLVPRWRARGVIGPRAAKSEQSFRQHRKIPTGIKSLSRPITGSSSCCIPPQSSGRRPRNVRRGLDGEVGDPKSANRARTLPAPLCTWRMKVALMLRLRFGPRPRAQSPRSSAGRRRSQRSCGAADCRLTRACASGSLRSGPGPRPVAGAPSVPDKVQS
jgi:hypothetical protein